MEHEEVRALAGAWLDREVDPLARREIEAHLAGCAECRAVVDGARAFSAAIRAEAEYFEAPPALVGKVTSSQMQSESVRMRGSFIWAGRRMVSPLLSRTGSFMPPIRISPVPSSIIQTTGWS